MYHDRGEYNEGRAFVFDCVEAGKDEENVGANQAPG